jgi:hypothetical protein
MQSNTPQGIGIGDNQSFNPPPFFPGGCCSIYLSNMPYSTERWENLMRCAPQTGEELDWYALDTKGHLAILATAGQGPVLSSIWSYREALNDFQETITKLSDVGLYEKVSVNSGPDWNDLACKGLFVFDYTEVRRFFLRRFRYELMARPKTILRAIDLVPNVDVRWLPVLEVDFTTCSFLEKSQIKTA